MTKKCGKKNDEARLKNVLSAFCLADFSDELKNIVVNHLRKFLFILSLNSLCPVVWKEAQNASEYFDLNEFSSNDSIISLPISIIKVNKNINDTIQIQILLSDS